MIFLYLAFLVIGGFKNSRSELKTCKRCRPAVSVKTPGILKCDRMTEFWVTINPEFGEILIGEAGNQRPFLAYREKRRENIKPINFLGFRTSKRHVGLFMLSEPTQVGCK